MPRTASAVLEALVWRLNGGLFPDNLWDKNWIMIQYQFNIMDIRHKFWCRILDMSSMILEKYWIIHAEFMEKHRTSWHASKSGVDVLVVYGAFSNKYGDVLHQTWVTNC